MSDVGRHIVLLVLCLGPFTVSAQERTLPVVPAPQAVQFGDGVAALPANLLVAAGDTTAMATALAQVRALVQAAERYGRYT